LDGRPVGCGESDVRLTKPVAGGLRADPELGEVTAVADRIAEVHDPATAQRFEDLVVEGEAGGEVSGLDREVIEHVAYSSTQPPTGM
jgi:hypothetical protein